MFGRTSVVSLLLIFTLVAFDIKWAMSGGYYGDARSALFLCISPVLIARAEIAESPGRECMCGVRRMAEESYCTRSDRIPRVCFKEMAAHRRRPSEWPMAGGGVAACVQTGT